MEQNALNRPILVLDDEVAIADLVVDLFASEGLEARAFYHPDDALDAARTDAFELAIVDVMMPGTDGFEFLRRLRATSDLPVIFLSAKDQETDIVVGFELGAEDYVTKPFKPRELLARVKARLRKIRAAERAVSEGRSSETAETRILEACGVELDPQAHTAALFDVPLSLTPKEFGILEMLLEHAGSPVASKDIYAQVWDEEPLASSTNTVMVHIRRLRRKLAAVDSSREIICTAWGVGYLIRED